MTSASRNPNVFPWLIGELCIGALALGLTALLSTELQPIARTAAALALLSGLISLGAVHIGCNKAGPNGLLAGIGAGFFVRMILLAVGLFATHARGDAALGYAFTFFAVFAITATAEVAYVIVRSRKPSARAEAFAASPNP